MDLPHVACDHQCLVSLKFHERCRWNKPIHSNSTPANFCENIVHLFNARDPLKGNAGVQQTLEIDFVRVLPQKKNVLANDESPDGLVDGRVIVLPLIDCEWEQMFRTSRDRGIVIADTAIGSHRLPPCKI